MGSKGDSYDNMLAETIDGLYKAELPGRRVRPSNWQRWNGYTGSIIFAGSNRLVIYRRPKLMQTTVDNFPSRLCRLTHTKRPPKIPGRFIFE